MAAYCTDSRLGTLAFQGARATAYTAMSSSVREAHLEAASREFDGYLRARFATTQLPLTTVDAAVEQWVADRAAWTLLRSHGFDSPAEGSSDYERSKELVRRGEMIAAGLVHLSQAAAPVSTSVTRVRSRTKRGWTEYDE